MSAPAGKSPVASPAIPVAMTDSGIKTVRKMLDDMKSQIQMALPRHMTADRMIRVALTSVQKNEKLLQCHPVTLIGAIVQLAQLGLEPDDGTGKAYLIPFWNGKKQRMEVQAMAGYRGLVALARNSGEIRDVIPHEVYDKDTFAYQFGTEQILTHIPYSGVDDRGKITHVYAIATYKDGGKPAFDVMTIAQVEEIHKKVMEKNKGDTGPWRDHYDEMAKKTVVRRLCKHLPSSPELQKAVTLDEKADFGLPQDLGKLIMPDQEKDSDAVESPPAPQRLSEGKKPALLQDEERAALIELMEDKGVDIKALNAYLTDKYGFTGTENIPRTEYQSVCQWIANGPQIEFGK